MSIMIHWGTPATKKRGSENAQVRDSTLLLESSEELWRPSRNLHTALPDAPGPEERTPWAKSFKLTCECCRSPGEQRCHNTTPHLFHYLRHSELTKLSDEVLEVSPLKEREDKRERVSKSQRERKTQTMEQFWCVCTKEKTEDWRIYVHIHVCTMKKPQRKLMD